MHELYNFSETQMMAFALVLIRVSAFIVVFPVFGVDFVPAQIKILLALAITLLVFPVVDKVGFYASFGDLSIVMFAMREVLVGLMFGFFTRLFFMTVRMAGDFISVSIGLSGAQLYNPSLGGMVTPTDTLFYSFACLIFLSLNGHHYFLSGLIDTFRTIPLDRESLSFLGFTGLGGLLQGMVQATVGLAAPVVVTILMANVVLGVIGKTVPQINVLVTSLVINAFLGLAILIIALPLMFDQIGNILHSSISDVFKIVKTI